MRSLLSELIEGSVKGVFSGILPGFHPILLSFSTSNAAAFAHGVYASVSVMPSILLSIFDVSLLYAVIVSQRVAMNSGAKDAIFLYLFGVLVGALLSVLYVPVSLVYNYRISSSFVFFVLLTAGAFVVLGSRNPWRAAILAALSSLFGYFVLKTPVAVVDPLRISIAGMFGMSWLVLSLLFHRSISVGGFRGISLLSLLRGGVAGLIMGVFVAYFPAMTLALAALFVDTVLRLNDREMLVAMGSASITSLFYSVFHAERGVIRTTLAAQISSFYLPHILAYLLMGAAFGVVLIYLFFDRLHRVYSSRYVKVAAIFAIISTSFAISGIAGALLLISASCLGMLPHFLGVEKRVLSFFLLFPTLLYYAPV